MLVLSATGGKGPSVAKCLQPYVGNRKEFQSLLNFLQVLWHIFKKQILVTNNCVCSVSLMLNTLKKKKSLHDFPGCPVVKTALPLQEWGLGPWLGLRSCRHARKSLHLCTHPDDHFSHTSASPKPFLEISVYWKCSCFCWLSHCECCVSD